MASVKSILNCIGVNTSGSVSILFHLFGFTRARVPPDPEPTATAQVSLLQLVRDLQGRHLHLNVIRVGFDTLSATDQATGDEKLDYAIYRIRNIYRGVSLGVGRVEHFAITAAQSNGRDDLGSEDEADQLSDEWSVPNNSIDVFVVRNISDTDFVGISPVGGSCDKGDDDDGLVGGEINRAAEGFSRTFAHEVGHFLDSRAQSRLHLSDHYGRPEQSDGPDEVRHQPTHFGTADRVAGDDHARALCGRQRLHGLNGDGGCRTITTSSALSNSWGKRRCSRPFRGFPPK